jgi:hypothetical protein
MNFRRLIVVAGVLGMLWVLALQGQVGAIEPPGSGSIVGPELWGVVVIDGSETPMKATLRVKDIVDCNVDTQAVVSNLTSCPTGANAVLNWKLTGVTLFGNTGTPIITKVKNYKEEKVGVNVVRVSCDVQIKFWVQ